MKNVLHVYSQNEWHDDAWIIGDEESLKALYVAIGEALKQGKASASSFVSDGEGFHTIILKADAEQIDSLKFPYIDEQCVCYGKKLKNPSDLLDPSQYQKLTDNA